VHALPTDLKLQHCHWYDYNICAAQMKGDGQGIALVVVQKPAASVLTKA